MGVHLGKVRNVTPSKERIGHDVPENLVRVKLEVTRRGKIIEKFLPKKKKRNKTRR